MTKIMQSGTPVLVITVPGVDLTGANAELLIRRGGALLELTGERLRITADETGSTVAVQLTQEESNRLQGGTADVQLKAVDGSGNALVSVREYVEIGAYIRPSVMAPGAGSFDSESSPLELELEADRVVAAVSPEVDAQRVDGGVEITVRDLRGEHAATVYDGPGVKAARVTSLTDTPLLGGSEIVEAVGIPVYVPDPAAYPAYGLTEAGWYVFARISAPAGITVDSGTRVTGAAAILTPGADHVDAAVRFEVAAQAQTVTVDWGSVAETYVFRAQDLAVRNLDYRTTYYVYDVEPFVTWEYGLTTDTTFQEDKTYFTKDGETYTAAEVIAGETVPADTYYNHTKLHFEGMTRNICYRLNTPIDCPIEIVFPEIPDDGYGCWFEIRVRATGAFSITPILPEGVQPASNTLAWTAKGIYYLDMHYANVAGLRLWRCVRTSFNI